ncbi:MAG: hypothetical protein M3R24_23505 [Chloroflexota bacterium]|nr:hypothetical protein [Chloroflexota bacterium]
MPAPKPACYTTDVPAQALNMDVDGLNFRRIGRLVRVHHHVVINWVNSQSA